MVEEDGTFSKLYIADTGYDPLAVSKGLLDNCHADKVVATGYGRYLAKEHFADSMITEIKAYALGANYLFPNCRNSDRCRRSGLQGDSRRT